MAAGDRLLDPDGNRILDADGNVMLSDGSGDDCCCTGCTCASGTPCTTCTSEGSITPITYRCVISGVPSGCCAETSSLTPPSIIPPDINVTLTLTQSGTIPCRWEGGESSGAPSAQVSIVGAGSEFNDATCSTACTSGTAGDCLVDTFVVQLTKSGGTFAILIILHYNANRSTLNVWNGGVTWSGTTTGGCCDTLVFSGLTAGNAESTTNCPSCAGGTITVTPCP